MLTILALWAAFATFCMSGIIYNALRGQKEVNPWAIVACWLFPWMLIILAVDILSTFIKSFNKNED